MVGMPDSFTRVGVLSAAMLSAVFVSCGGAEQKSPGPAAPKSVEISKPSDESRRFPKTNLVNTTVVEKGLMEKSFMPGGTLAVYKRGKTEYQAFVAKLPSASDAALLLLDWRKELTEPKLVPSFGGYFGKDSDRPTFVFSKGDWVAGIVGLTEKEADLQARALAGQLN